LLCYHHNIVDAITKKEISTSKRISPILSEDSIFQVLAQKLNDGLKKKTELFYTEKKGFLNYPEHKLGNRALTNLTTFDFSFYENRFEKK